MGSAILADLKESICHLIGVLRSNTFEPFFDGFRDCVR